MALKLLRQYRDDGEAKLPPSTLIAFNTIAGYIGSTRCAPSEVVTLIRIIFSKDFG